MWIYSPPKPPKPKVPEALKAEVTEKGNVLIEMLKPQHIQKPRRGYKWNYIVDLYTKWYRSYFYFCSKWASPGPNAISPFFEMRFARMEYVGGRSFNLSFMRYTGEWIETEQRLTVDRCIEVIKEGGFYSP
jgi:hypothetical protein